jgi:hypothetical protein
MAQDITNRLTGYCICIKSQDQLNLCLLTSLQYRGELGKPPGNAQHRSSVAKFQAAIARPVKG